MKRAAVLIVAAMLFMTSAAIPVAAQSPTCTWAGCVMFNESLVPNNTEIRAKVGAKTVGTATTWGSDYYMIVNQTAGFPPEGATVDFYILIFGMEYLAPIPGMPWASRRWIWRL